MPKNQPLRIADSRRAAASGSGGGSVLPGHTHDSRYYQESEVDSLLAASIAAHKSEADAHPGYLTPTEAAAAYSALGHSHAAGEISGLAEAAQDASAGMLTTATHDGVSATYDDAGGKLALTNADKGSAAVSSHVGAADAHAMYALLAGRAGGQSLAGGNAANDDLTLQGTTHATRTSSYVLLQPNGGYVGIGTSAPQKTLDIVTGSTLAMRALSSASEGDGRYSGAGMYLETTHLPTEAGRRLGLIFFGADNGTEYTPAGIAGYSAESWSGTGKGAYFDFEVTAIGDTFRTKAMRIFHDGNVGLNTTAPTISDGVGLDINGKILRLRSSKTPATAGAAGNVGEICWDSNYIYVCVAANTWKRAAIATW